MRPLDPRWFEALAFTVGACIGSFLNVCIHRLPKGASIVAPRSACPGCGRLIAWYDNVPIVSWLLLRGRCRGCRGPIAVRYPLVEAATGLLFLALAMARGPSFAWLEGVVFAAAIVALIFIDAEHQILPDAITLPGIAAGIALAPLSVRFAPPGDPPPGLVDRLLAAVIGYALLFLVNASYRGWQAMKKVPEAERLDGIGQGDYKLLSMIGAFLGLRLMLFTLFAGAVGGAVCGLYLMAFRGYQWRSKLPYGVFLGAAALLALFFGEPAIRWYVLRLGGEP
jgi:leader peptidase (prepilin peptidase) / N-methyltransferase